VIHRVSNGERRRDIFLSVNQWETRGLRGEGNPKTGKERREEMCFRKQNQKNMFQEHKRVDKKVHHFGRDVTTSSTAPSGSNLQVPQHDTDDEHSSICA
jgi:hypothetical protein